MQLSEAQEAVRSELQRLDNATERVIEQVNHTMNEASALVEARRQEMMSAVAQAAQEKRKVLEEQLTIIEGEKNKVVLLVHLGFDSHLINNYFSRIKLNSNGID